MWPGSREYLRSLVPWPHLARILLPVQRVILKPIHAGVGFGSGTETRNYQELEQAYLRETVADTDQFLWLPLKPTQQLMCAYFLCTHTYVGIHHLCYPTWIQNLWSVTVKYLSTSEPSLLCITQIPTWIPTNDEVFFFLIVYCPTSEDTMACIHSIVDAYTWTINGPHLSVKRQVCTRFRQSYPLRRTHTTLVELSAIVDYGNQWYPVTAEFHRGF